MRTRANYLRVQEDLARLREQLKQGLPSWVNRVNRAHKQRQARAAAYAESRQASSQSTVDAK